MRIDPDARFPRDGGAYHVADSHHMRAFGLGFAQRRQRVRGFPGLRDDDRKVIFAHQRISVAKLRGILDLDRQSRQLFNLVFAD